MTANTPSKTLLRIGIVLGAAGIAGLLAVAFTDLGKADQIASVSGAVLTLAGLGLSLWAQFGSRGEAAVEASGTRSVAAGGNIGAAVTGDGATAPVAPSTMPGGTTAPGPVTASGERSVAAGGDIGSATTGDA